MGGWIQGGTISPERETAYERVNLGKEMMMGLV